MLRLQQANQPAPQAGLFPAVENPTAIPARMSRDKTGRVKVSSVVPTGPRLAAMLTVGALCRDQVVKRVVETAASQRLVVMAIQDKPKVRASSIFEKGYGNETGTIYRFAGSQRTAILLCTGRGFFVRCWIGDCLRKRSTSLIFS